MRWAIHAPIVRHAGRATVAFRHRHLDRRTSDSGEKEPHKNHRGQDLKVVNVMAPAALESVRLDAFPEVPEASLGPGTMPARSGKRVGPVERFTAVIDPTLLLSTMRSAPPKAARPSLQARGNGLICFSSGGDPDVFIAGGTFYVFCSSGDDIDWWTEV